MQILLLNGTDEYDDIGEIVCRSVEEISEGTGNEVTQMVLRNTEMADCPGDYDCFFKTPGVCTRKDDGQVYLEKLTKCHLVVAVTPVHYGGYSVHLSKAIHRSLPCDVPLLKKRQGEVHFQTRYDRCPSFLVIGLLPEKNEEKERVFKKLVEQNAVSFNTPTTTLGFITESMAEEAIVDEVRGWLEKVGVKQ